MYNDGIGVGITKGATMFSGHGALSRQAAATHNTYGLQDATRLGGTNFYGKEAWGYNEALPNVDFEAQVADRYGPDRSEQPFNPEGTIGVGGLRGAGVPGRYAGDEYQAFSPDRSPSRLSDVTIDVTPSEVDFSDLARPDIMDGPRNASVQAPNAGASSLLSSALMGPETGFVSRDVDTVMSNQPIGPAQSFASEVKNDFNNFSQPSASVSGHVAGTGMGPYGNVPDASAKSLDQRNAETLAADQAKSLASQIGSIEQSLDANQQAQQSQQAARSGPFDTTGFKTDDDWSDLGLSATIGAAAIGQAPLSIGMENPQAPQVASALAAPATTASLLGTVEVAPTVAPTPAAPATTVAPAAAAPATAPKAAAPVEAPKAVPAVEAPKAVAPVQAPKAVAPVSVQPMTTKSIAQTAATTATQAAQSQASNLYSGYANAMDAMNAIGAGTIAAPDGFNPTVAADAFSGSSTAGASYSALMDSVAEKGNLSPRTEIADGFLSAAGVPTEHHGTVKDGVSGAVQGAMMGGLPGAVVGGVLGATGWGNKVDSWLNEALGFGTKVGTNKDPYGNGRNNPSVGSDGWGGYSDGSGGLGNLDAGSLADAYDSYSESQGYGSVSGGGGNSGGGGMNSNGGYGNADGSPSNNGPGIW